MIAGKWQERHKKQVEANNLLHEKLRATRRAAKTVVGLMQAQIEELKEKLGEPPYELSKEGKIPEQAFSETGAAKVLVEEVQETRPQGT